MAKQFLCGLRFPVFVLLLTMNFVLNIKRNIEEKDIVVADQNIKEGKFWGSRQKNRQELRETCKMISS